MIGDTWRGAGLTASAPALLNRIESGMPDAAPELQWTMNNTLAAIGIHVPELRKRAIATGEKSGIYRDYPTSKGCTSPFPPIWINEIVLGKVERSSYLPRSARMRAPA